MDRLPGILIKFINSIVFILVITGCAVVKTPYSRSDYYSETISALEKIETENTEVNDSLYAGFSKMNIVPDMEMISGKKRGKKQQIPIAGYGQMKTKYATGIHDSVFVRAVALRTGQHTSIIVSGEMLIMPPNIADSVVSALAKKGIRRNQLFFTATHTHSGIGGWGYGCMAKLMAGRRNRSIEEWLVSRISQAVLSAVADLKPAFIGFDSFEAPDFTVNRLTGNPEHNNTSFDYIKISQSVGRNAIIGTYSAHPTTSTRKNTLISGDYPGCWSRTLENTGIDVAMFCGGSMGGQSPSGKGNEFESACFIGRGLADSVLSGMSKIELSNIISSSSISLKTSLPEYHFRMSANRNFTTGLSESLNGIS